MAIKINDKVVYQGTEYNLRINSLRSSKTDPFYEYLRRLFRFKSHKYFNPYSSNDRKRLSHIPKEESLIWITESTVKLWEIVNNRLYLRSVGKNDAAWNGSSGDYWNIGDDLPMKSRVLGHKSTFAKWFTGRLRLLKAEQANELLNVGGKDFSHDELQLQFKNGLLIHSSFVNSRTLDESEQPNYAEISLLKLIIRRLFTKHFI